MPSWGNTDSVYDKPHWPKERQGRPVVRLATANQQTSGNTLYFTASDVSAYAIANGMYVSSSNTLPDVSITGEAGFLSANNTVNNVLGGLVRLANNIMRTVPAGQLIEFDLPIAYQASERSSTYNQDTVLVTQTRLANAVFANSTVYSSAALANSGGAAAHSGWVNVVTGTGGRQGRVQTEVLIALANASATIAYSGNTSNIATYYSSL
jgi:hypothetical protein